MQRYFEKISYDQFKKDISDNKELYDSYNIPKRKTKYAAGYDIFLIEDLVINPNEIIKIPTGIKANMLEDEVLFLIIRSGMGFKYNIKLCNRVGIIDKDYYNNLNNEGHIFLKIQNEGKSKVEIKKGESICQGIFMKYLKVDNEIEDFIERKGKY